MFRDREEAARLLARRFDGREFAIPWSWRSLAAGSSPAPCWHTSWAPSSTSSCPASSAPRSARAGHRGRRRGRPGLPQSRGQGGPRPGRPVHYPRDRTPTRRDLSAEGAFRAARPQATLEGRSVIVTDDGIATGATMIAALDAARTKLPFELIVAVPVASPDRLREVRRHCDELICLLAPRSFWAIGQFYGDFTQVEDDRAVELLCSATTARARGERVVARMSQRHVPLESRGG